jgi:ABC-type phosphate transport system permease subunit
MPLAAYIVFIPNSPSIGSARLKTLLNIAWERFSVNSAIVADINGRFIATAFYFTIMAPFGLLSAIFMDPLRRKKSAANWLDREPLSTEISAAREQG